MVTWLFFWFVCSFTGTVAEGAPVIPISAQLKYPVWKWVNENHCRSTKIINKSIDSLKCHRMSVRMSRKYHWRWFSMINQFKKSVTNRWKIKDISKIRTVSKKLIGLSHLIELINEHNVKIHGIYIFFNYWFSTDIYIFSNFQ